MKKTYWWRILIFAIIGIGMGVSYILRNQEIFGMCDHIYWTDSYSGCLDKSALTIGKPLLFLSFSLLVVFPFLFFVRDNVFRRWAWFALVWFGITVVLIMLTPEHAGYILNLGPTKESVSLAMSVLFVPVSLAKLFLDSKRKAKSA